MYMATGNAFGLYIFSRTSVKMKVRLCVKKHNPLKEGISSLNMLQ